MEFPFDCSFFMCFVFFHTHHQLVRRKWTHLSCLLPAESPRQSAGLGDFMRTLCCSIQMEKGGRHPLTLFPFTREIQDENLTLLIFWFVYTISPNYNLLPFSGMKLFNHSDRFSGWQVGQIILCTI